MNDQKNIKTKRPLEDYFLIGVLSILALYVLFLIGKATIITIPEESRGVMFKRFDGGLKVEKVYDPGYHFVVPWDNMIIYDISTQQDSRTIDAMSSDEASVSIEVKYSFNPIPTEIGHLHNEIGLSYAERIIEPEIGFAVREIIKNHSRFDLTDSNKILFEEEIEALSKRSIETKYIELTDLQVISMSRQTE